LSIVNKLLYDYGFNYVFDNQSFVNEVAFLSMFKQNYLDIVPFDFFFFFNKT